MKVKILGNVQHNGVSLVGGDIVDIPEKQAKLLIKGLVAEQTTEAETKEAPKPKHKKLGEEIVKIQEAAKKKNKKRNK